VVLGVIKLRNSIENQKSDDSEQGRSSNHFVIFRGGNNFLIHIGYINREVFLNILVIFQEETEAKFIIDYLYL